MTASHTQDQNSLVLVEVRNLVLSRRRSVIRRHKQDKNMGGTCYLMAHKNEDGSVLQLTYASGKFVLIVLASAGFLFLSENLVDI